ncbi:hypothetical protein TRFO_37512 [Tritrichomonas foetus]|uniref:Surface antigen BspA-like n=1 Tax=Tritrichomonas foetus TaxID=1144522 RepID=A0A1J4JAZ2_9EUKA|nr:hypothetical protein TRFO_37512 [Tritrichomonas foetus]|eukprot:OHS96320.1 hypothetical protein TRFO_37512 [Tritrichomonas foetus]
MLSPKKKGVIITVNKINYKLHQTSCTATIVESPTASGDIIIPKSIEKGSRTYVIKKIANSSFENAPITSLSFSDDSEINEIGSNCFGLATPSALKKLSIPKSLEVLDEDWCFMTPNLVDINLDRSNKNFLLENNILYNSNKTSILFVSRNQTSLTIQKTIKKISASACQYSKIQEIEYENDSSSLEMFGRSAFFGCRLTKVYYPMSVKIIGDFAFNGNRDLSIIRFEEGSQIERIGVCAFLGCDLMGEIICSSANLSRIGRECFEENDRLVRFISVYAHSIEIGRDAFKGTSPQFELVIGESTKLRGKGIPPNVVRRSSSADSSMLLETPRKENDSLSSPIVQERNISSLELDVDDKDQEIERLRKELKAKDEQIEKLKEENRKLNQKGNSEKDLENENSRLKEKLARMKKLVASLQNELDDV